MNPGKSKAKMATKKTAAGTAAAGKSSKGFSDFEKAAMKERARELKMASSRAEGEKALLAKIAEMSEPDRSMAKRLHAIVTAAAPDLAPKTWYGMPAYTATKRSSASSKAPTSSRPATPRSASTM